MKNNIENTIRASISKAVRNAYSYSISIQDIMLERPQDESHGDWSANIAMTLASQLRKSPREIADKIVSELKKSKSEKIEKVETADPGFVNFKLADNQYIQNLEQILREEEDYGNSDRLSGKRIMIEFAHPNPFKAFHIGHLRNIILGESLVRLTESQGAKVIRANYQGDVGMHIAKCLWALKDIDSKNYPDTADEKVALLGKLYAKGASAFEEDPKAKQEITAINKKIYTKEDSQINKLWTLGKKWSLEKFHEIYKRLYTTFEREYFESETLDTCKKYIEKAQEKGILKESQGAIVFDGSKYGLDTRVFLNSEGLPTYEGKELGLAYMEFTDYGNIDLCIHNVAVEQISFFKVTFKVEELLEPKLFKDRQYHNAYEFVGLKKGKMSSRKGNVILGNDILNEAHNKIAKVISDRKEITNKEETAEIIGVGAVKWSFLKISPFKYLAFDLESSLNFDGDSGPYLQYTYARSRSILREAEKSETDKKTIGNILDSKESVLQSDEEKSLLRWLERFPEVVEKASIDYSPNLICSYLFDLAQRFNSFYKNNPVLKAEREEDKIARLALTKATSIVIKRGLDLLGIKTVEKM